MSAQRYAQPELLSIQLFGFETGEGYRSLLWQNPQNFFNSRDLEKPYLYWKETKRDFTPDEVLSCSWVYISYRGTAHVFEFAQNRTVRTVQGTPLFNDSKRSQGSWGISRLDDGLVLDVVILNQIRFFVFAECNRPIYSGIMFQRGQNIPHYIKFIPIR